MGTSGPRRPWSCSLTVLLLSILVPSACAPGGTPGPPGAFDSIPPDTLIHHIENDLEFDTLRLYGDEQRLMLGTCPVSCSYGPRVKIEPETRSHRNELSALGAGPGRIVARMISYDTTAYPKFNLGAEDTVYWAITRATATRNPDSLASVSLFISIKGLRGGRTPAITQDTTFIEQHGSGYHQHARAYWIWSDSDETAWGSCAKGACCR